MHPGVKQNSKQHAEHSFNYQRACTGPFDQQMRGKGHSPQNNEQSSRVELWAISSAYRRHAYEYESQEIVSDGKCQSENRVSMDTSRDDEASEKGTKALCQQWAGKKRP